MSKPLPYSQSFRVFHVRPNMSSICCSFYGSCQELCLFELFQTQLIQRFLLLQSTFTILCSTMQMFCIQSCLQSFIVSHQPVMVNICRWRPRLEPTLRGRNGSDSLFSSSRVLNQSFQDEMKGRQTAALMHCVSRVQIRNHKDDVRTVEGFCCAACVVKSLQANG